MRKRSVLLHGVGVIGAAAITFSALPAMASTTALAGTVAGTTGAASVSAALKAEISEELAYNPSGEVINDRQISYDNGKVTVTVPRPGVRPAAASKYGCPSGTFCLWEYSGYNGDMVSFEYPLDTNIQLRAYLPQQESAYNARNTGSILQPTNYENPVCYSSGQAAPSIGSPYRTYPWLYLEQNDNC
jgi:hypothetical protein